MAFASLLFLGGLATLAEANSFLGRPQSGSAIGLSAESEHALLHELEIALGSGHRHATEKRLKRIEQRLNPMFAAMTKNSHGNLDQAAAGYMLHRIFVQRHGWFIRSLEPAGGSMAAWNTSSPTSILEERVPTHVQELFEKRLGEHGLSVKDIAILAGTLEHLVHSESLERLNVAYDAQSFKKDDVLSEEEALKVLDTYMSIYILGFMHTDNTTMPANTAQQLHASINEMYPTWNETQQFLKETYQSVAPKRDYLYFNEMENVIAEVGERYGRFQDIECRMLKDLLVAKEDSSVGGAGRVRISDFYKMAIQEGRWQFSESVSYMRQLGALDESDPSNPRVIIPNYISGPSNCVASSAYYSVCCLDECESILGRLEETIGAPEASPSTILALIPTIPSATVPSDRTLSPWLLHRLQEVAKHHDGSVPLHVHLFAQWLHYAYPRECQFPHVSGTTSPQRPEDILAASNTTEDVSASEKEMHRIVAAAPPLKQRTPESEAGASEESALWSMDEELVVWRAPQETQASAGLGTFRTVAMVGAAASFAAALVRTLGMTTSKGKTASESTMKYYV